MINNVTTSTLMLSIKARFTHSLTSAVELAMKTKSPKHIVLAENLLKVKRAAPDTHLESLTRYNHYLCCRPSRYEKRIREDKYQYLANQLDQVKEMRRFLYSGLPTEDLLLVSRPNMLCRKVNERLAQNYTNAPRLYAIRASIVAISQNIGQKKGGVSIDNFSHLAKDIHTMIDTEKPLADIANRVTAFKAHHRLY